MPRCDDSLEMKPGSCDNSGHHGVRVEPASVGEAAANLSQSHALTSGATSRESDDLFYLFICGLRWHAEANTGCGWDLIEGLRSSDWVARTLCADLLTKTKNGRVLASELRRAQAAIRDPVFHREKLIESNPGEVTMNTPYGLEMSDSCLTCKLSKDRWFCRFSHESLKSLSGASHLATYPGGALLFVEGQTPRGAHILCSGKVKLSTTSREGKVLILKMAEAGSVLGLSAVIAGEPYQLTAETAMPCQVNFVEREALIRLIEKNGEIGLHSTEVLSREFQSAYRDIHDLILARSSAGKLARLLLSWTPGRDIAGAKELRIRSGVTHEEMAQMIGSSRETVTRLLSDLKKKELIRLEGSTLVIRNRVALEAMAA